MNIIVNLECSDTALARSRKVASKYIPQIGRRTFSGKLSKAGLNSMMEEFKAIASKNSTIVVNKTFRNGTEPVAIIGSKQLLDGSQYPFKESGVFEPIKGDVNQIISLITKASALFHDLGKASYGFQLALLSNVNKKERTRALVRHELYSSMICAHAFEFAYSKSNHCIQKTLTYLSCSLGIQESFNYAVHKIDSELDGVSNTPTKVFRHLRSLMDCTENKLHPLLKVVIWLTLTHHKLTNELSDNSALHETESMRIRNTQNGNQDEKQTIKINFDYHVSDKDDICPIKTKPFLSCDPNTQLWRPKRKNRWSQTVTTTFAHMADVYDENILSSEDLWCLAELYCRPALVFGDYYGSSKKEACEEGDPNTQLYANTIESGKHVLFADNLETHTLKVTKEAVRYCKLLSKGKHNCMRSIHKSKVKRLFDNAINQYESTPSKFKWQAEASNALHELKKSSPHPTISIVYSGTGHGKTIGMGLMAMSQNDSPRFTVALGRRGLSQQTYREYTNTLGLSEYTSLLIGGETKAFTRHDDEEVFPLSGTYNDIEQSDDSGYSIVGCHNHNDDELPNELDVLTKNEKEKLLIQSPVAVMTIDHFTQASDFSRSPNLKNILRPLSSDLILDEIDDYSQEQLGALAWLVLLHGAYGRNVIIASATITPSLVGYFCATFKKGAQIFAKIGGTRGGANICMFSGESGLQRIIRSASADNLSNDNIENEFRSLSIKAEKRTHSKQKHIVKTMCINEHKGDLPDQIYDTLGTEITKLHQNNALSIEGKRVSFGVVKLNRTDDVIGYSKHLAQFGASKEISTKVVCYHSKFDSCSKAFIESWMTKNLDRKNIRTRDDQGLTKLLSDPYISSAIQQTDNDLCIVFVSTNIIEVGRDVDFDWGIYEPSGYQSLVQFVGRVNRHRDMNVESQNISILSHTLSELAGSGFCHFGVGSSSALNIRDEKTFRSAAKPVIPHRKTYKNDIVASVKGLCDSLFDVTDIDNLGKFTLNTLSFNIRSRLLLGEALCLEDRLFNTRVLPYDMVLPDLYAITRDLPEQAKTRNWYKSNRLRSTSRKITIYNQSGHFAGNNGWRFLDSKGVCHNPAFSVIEEEDPESGWLFSDNIIDMKEYIRQEFDVTMGISFDVEERFFNSAENVYLSARTGVKR